MKIVGSILVSLIEDRSRCPGLHSPYSTRNSRLHAVWQLRIEPEQTLRSLLPLLRSHVKRAASSSQACATTFEAQKHQRDNTKAANTEFTTSHHQPFLCMMALPLSTSGLYSTPTNEKHFSSQKVSENMVGSEGEAGIGGGGGDDGERSVSNSPLRDLEMLAEMEERGGLDLRSVSNSPLRDLEMLAEMEERGYGDNRSVSNSPLRDLEMLAQMVESSGGNGRSSSSSRSPGNDNGIVATTSNLVSSPHDQDTIMRATAVNETSGNDSSIGVTAGNGSGNSTNAINNPQEKSHSPGDPAAFANTASNSDNANNQTNNQVNNGPNTLQDRLLASRNTFHRLYHMMLDMGPAQPGEKSESSSPVTDRGKPRKGDNGTEGSASMSISPLSDTLNTIAAAALIHEAGIRLEQLASVQASQHRSHATYAPGSPDDEPHSQDSGHEVGLEDQFADEDQNDDADEDDAAADENSGEVGDEDNNENASEDPEGEEYEDADEDADGDDEHNGSDEESDSEETPESLSARHRLLDDFENYFVAPEEMEALRHTLFSESDSDLTSLGGTPPPEDSELRELELQRKLRQKPLCVCKGWCSCQKYKVFYGSWVDAPNKVVNSHNPQDLEANGFELPSQTHLPEHVITGEVFPEASMRSTLHRGQDGVPVTPPAEQPYNHVFSWDQRPRPRRPPPGWQGVWIPEGEQSIEEILGHGESAIWKPRPKLQPDKRVLRDDSGSSLASLDTGHEDEQLDDDLDVTSEPDNARENGVEDASPSEEMELDENGDVDTDFYECGEVLDNAIEKVATNSASVESDEVC